MLLSEMQARVQRFLATEDTVQSAISIADITTELNATGIEYLARYLTVYRNAALRNAASGANHLTVGVAGDGQWVECARITRSIDNVALRRSSFAKVVAMEEDRGYTVSTGLGAKPDQYGLALVSRAIDGASLFNLVVAPRPSVGVVGYTAEFRPYASELSAGTDFFECDDNHADQICRITALRLGRIEGYGTLWYQQTLAPLPEQIQREMMLIDEVLEPVAAEPQSPAPEAA